MDAQSASLYLCQCNLPTCIPHLHKWPKYTRRNANAHPLQLIQIQPVHKRLMMADRVGHQPQSKSAKAPPLRHRVCAAAWMHSQPRSICASAACQPTRPKLGKWPKYMQNNANAGSLQPIQIQPVQTALLAALSTNRNRAPARRRPARSRWRRGGLVLEGFPIDRRHNQPTNQTHKQPPKPTNEPTNQPMSFLTS